MVLYKSNLNMAIAKLHLLAILIISLLLSACSQETESSLYNKKLPQTSITIVAVGDIMLGGTAQEILMEEGYDYPFKNVKSLFTDTDIAIGNLEGPLTSICNSDMELDKTYVFRSPAPKVAPALKKAGFNILNLANNHILDYGVQGMNDTIDALNKHNIYSVGAGENSAAARSGTIIDTANGKLGFLSYSLTFPESFWATDEKAGVAFGHEKQITADIKRLKKSTDSVIVSFHWGREKITELRPYQPRLGRAAIDAGASIVLGHHPHVLQAIEQYNKGLIIYSLGNFVFGSYSQDAKTSVVARITLNNGQFYSAELTPINVLNTEVVFQPQILQQSAAIGVIEHINTLSKASNTRLDQLNYRGYLHASENKIQSLARNN
ncbi:MAG: capsular biosynthesis protein [endosymbiont of Galathealinum brachiosum]|uniref:Capsular biosynthesis protein n=1 Tax=endosymbiont of Galathealinum brachiosum TaxID=2200906 RepID=A0A370DFN0_9GAMM|nr:MAG: capsular biosynthesis protein [endosymbiont of Galathealinum brachiosum]